MPDYEKAYDEHLRKHGVPQRDSEFAANLIAWHKRLGGTGEIPEELLIAAGQEPKRLGSGQD